MSKPMDPQAVMNFFQEKLGARFKMWLKICAHCSLCADTCHFYLASDRDPRMIPAHKVRFIPEILKRKGHLDEGYLKQVYETVYYECNMCRRCALFCPFGIDIALMVSLLRTFLFQQGILPEGLLNAINNYKAEGNQMAVTKDDWIETVEWCEEETAEELNELKIPMDMVGCKMMYTINAREAKFYPQDINEVSKIFHVAGESWTVPTEAGWDDTNLPMFCGDAPTSRMIVENTFKRADELGADKVVITE